SSANKNGQISGVVTKASGGAPIEGIQVCAFPTAGGDSFGCANTNASGEYTISGLAEGSFRVNFSTSACNSSCSNYVGQYYNDKPSFETAEEVAVLANKTTTGIDASLVEGGQVMGRVTSAASGAPLAGIEACADSGQTSNCASTDGNGEYTVKGLATSSYTVTFSSAANYLTRYYNEQSTAIAAEPISVEAGKT